MISKPAPSAAVLLQGLLKGDPQRALDLLMWSGERIDDSDYRHWQDLTHRTPPATLSHEEWWFLLKQQRRAQRRDIPLRQKNGDAFWFALTDEVLHLSEEVARRTGGAVAGNGALTENGRNQYIVRSLVEESITSSQLEGASTSRRVALEMLDSGREPRSRAEQMILNNYLGMQWAKDHDQTALSPEDILELHRILTADTLDDPADAGRLDQPGVERVCVWQEDVCVHVPPPAEELPQRLDELCAFLNGSADERPYVPPVVRAIITHFMFGYDHYFADGNGRTARTMFYWAMMRNGFWLAEYLTISKILKKAPGQYGRSYEMVEDDEGDVTYFILYQLKVIIRALDELDEYLATKQREATRVDRALRHVDAPFNHRQTVLLETLVRGSALSLTVRDVEMRYRVSPQTARNDLNHLEGLGFLRRGASKKPVTWYPVEGLSEKVRELGERRP